LNIVIYRYKSHFLEKKKTGPFFTSYGRGFFGILGFCFISQKTTHKGTGIKN